MPSIACLLASSLDITELHISSQQAMNARDPARRLNYSTRTGGWYVSCEQCVHQYQRLPCAPGTPLPLLGSCCDGQQITETTLRRFITANNCDLAGAKKQVSVTCRLSRAQCFSFTEHDGFTVVTALLWGISTLAPQSLNKLRRLRCTTTWRGG